MSSSVKEHENSPQPCNKRVPLQVIINFDGKIINDFNLIYCGTYVCGGYDRFFFV